MLRNINGESLSSQAGRGVASPGLDAQESSWIGMLSRPAMAFLQRYLPGRPQTQTRAGAGAGWVIGGGLTNSFVDDGRELLRQLDDMMPLPPDGVAGLLEPRAGTLPWLTADSLLEMGIRSSEDLDMNLCQQTQIGYLSSVRTFFSHVSSVSVQDMKATVEPAGPPAKGPAGRSRTWWGSFWLGEDSPQKGLPSGVSWAQRGRLHPQRPAAGTKAAGTMDLLVQRWTLGENTGPTDLTEEPADSGGLKTVQNAEGSVTMDPRLGIGGHLSGSGAACSVAATPDQDHGYFSLEEEHVQGRRLGAEKPPSERRDEMDPAVETETEEGESTSGKEEEEEEEEGEREAAPRALTHPECQNKAIAFIMGCPCSDDSQSDGGSSDDDDDAGFDSESSSDRTDSTDDEEDGEEDSEAEPYDPRSFAARQHTSTPRAVPAAATPPSSARSTPASSPELAPPPLAASPPQSGSDFWDDSTSASEADEAESLRLLSSFSCSSDPYSPFNFQAPLRTREPAGPRTRTRAKKAPQTPSCLPPPKPASPPEYRKEEAEERLDSGFSEPCSTSSASSQRCTTKKVSWFSSTIMF